MRNDWQLGVPWTDSGSFPTGCCSTATGTSSEKVTTIVRGDRTSLSIAAASIVAKVTRDRLLRDGAESYPMYNFEANKGYPCPQHKIALHAYGPSAIHRRSWAFMDGLVWSGLPRFARPDPQLRLAI